MVEEVLHHFGDTLARIEVHFSDEINSQDSDGVDKRCVLKALVGVQSVTVSRAGSSLEEALTRAADTLQNTLKQTLRLVPQ